MTITVNHVVETQPWRFCAFCDKNESHYTIRPLPTHDVTDKRFLRCCIDCYNDLVAGSSPAGCAFCGNLAQYGSTSAQRYNQFGSRTSVDIRHIPDERVLCESHLTEIRDELESDRVQYTLDDFL
jgi:hypothetical protein